MSKGLNEDDISEVALALHDFLVKKGLLIETDSEDATFVPLEDCLQDLLEPYINCDRNYN